MASTSTMVTLPTRTCQQEALSRTVTEPLFPALLTGLQEGCALRSYTGRKSIQSFFVRCNQCVQIGRLEMHSLRTRPVLTACRLPCRVHCAMAAPALSKHGQKYFEKDKRPIVLFDGVCNCASRNSGF